MAMRYLLMLLLTWGTVVGAVGSALWLAKLNERPPTLGTDASVSYAWGEPGAPAQAGRPQRLPGPLADAASAPAARR